MLFVNVERVPFSSDSLRLQRFIGGSVAALLTANAFAVTAARSDDDDRGNRLRRPAPLGEAIRPPSDDDGVHRLITTADGQTFLADPATAEGRRAIETARDDGSTVREVRSPGTESDGQPAATGDLLDLGEVLGPLSGAEPPDDGQEDGTSGLLEPDLVEGLLDDPVGTVGSLLESAPSTVDGAIDEVDGAVDSLLGQTLLPTTTTTVASTDPAPTTTPTTTAGSNDDGVCTLLILC